MSYKNTTPLSYKVFGGAVVALLGVMISLQAVIVHRGTPVSTLMARAEQMLTKYPAGHFENTIEHAFKTIENLHKLSARAHYLSEHMEPVQIEKLSKSLESINVREITGLAMNANRIMSLIETKDITDAVASVKNAADHLDMTKLNELMDNTKAIESRLRNLHEIKINL